METLSVYQRALAAGLQIDHHGSDLYIRPVDVARPIVESCGWAYTSFVDSAGHFWLDVPFAYEPFWSKKGPTRTPSSPPTL